MAESGCDIQLVLDAKTDLGESPAWDARSQRLYFVDIYGKSIHIYDPATKEHVQIDTPELPGTVVPTSNPDVLLAAFDRWVTSQRIVTIDMLCVHLSRQPLVMVLCKSANRLQ